METKILEDINLLKKYDVYAFDYIEYPHKSFWKRKEGGGGWKPKLSQTTDKLTSNIEVEGGDSITVNCENGVNADDYFAAWQAYRDAHPERPVLLYVHIPFCEELCSFCICHRQITNKYDIAKDYLYNSLFREIDLIDNVFSALGWRPSVLEVYFGGGSPTFLREEEFKALLNKLDIVFNLSTVRDMTIEIDPRRIEENRLHFYSQLGVNRLSFGIQDFDLKVQSAINRVQPAELTSALLTREVRKKFKSINFDLLVGLPGQTPRSIGETVRTLVEMKPTRVSLAYLHYGPKFHLHQRLMLKESLLPDFYERKELFVTALNGLAQGGYVRTGFEHFALPDDAVAKAMQEEKVLYNSLGSTSGDTVDILAIGRSAYSTIGDYYFQTVYDQSEYDQALIARQYPVLRGYKLTSDDKIRRYVIKTIRTYFKISVLSVEETYSIKFFEYFASEIQRLREFESDGLVSLSNDMLTLTEAGKHFANLIGSVFDSFISEKLRHRPNVFTSKTKRAMVPIRAY